MKEDGETLLHKQRFWHFSRVIVIAGAAWFGVSVCRSLSQTKAVPTQPTAHGPVAQVTDLGPIKTNRDIMGRDGGSSALFQGHSIWLYGDTFLEKPDALGRGLVSNTWSYTKAGCTRRHFGIPRKH